MAPEFPPSLVIFDARFENEQLVGSLEYVEAPKNKRLRVRWNVTAQPTGYISVGGGVAYVYDEDVILLPVSKDAKPSDLGDKYQWTEGSNPEVPSIMFILILPKGYTLSMADPRPVGIKIYKERLSFYWILKSKNSENVTTEFALIELQQDINHELIQLNNDYLSRPSLSKNIDIEDREFNRSPIDEVNTKKLRKLLVDHFDDSEIRDLCFDLNIDYESLPGEGKSNKARELVSHAKRHGNILALVETCKKLRPHLSWPVGDTPYQKTEPFSERNVKSVFEQATHFSGLTSITEKKRLIHDIEYKINENQFDLSDDEMTRCARSVLELERIGLYIYEEHKSTSNIMIRILHVRHEFELVRTSTETKSLIPLHYAVRSILKSSQRNLDYKAALIENINLFEELLEFLKVRTDVDKGGEIKGNLNKILQLSTTYHDTSSPDKVEQPMSTAILFLAADPTDASRLRLGEEVREIQEKLQLARLRDKFILHQRMSVRPADISQALLDIQPRIVHFSGHGASDGALLFEDINGQMKLISPKALAALFEQFTDTIECVILNACYSETQARAIANHIPYVVGMNQPIGDKAAISFTVGIYQALGAGRSFEQAFRLGCIQIGLQGIPEELTPILIKKSPTS
jgi:hypothetical protein